jgi:hypothetical protein
MTKRFFTHHLVIALLGVFAAGLSFPQIAASDPTIYALTYDGYLMSATVAADGSTVTAGTLRAQLASPYRSIRSFTYAGTYFYASYGAGRIVRFGFTDGDELDLGATNYTLVEGMATRSDGTVFVSYWPNGSWTNYCSTHSGREIGTLNLSTLTITPTVAFQRYGNDQYWFPLITGLAFDSSDNLWMLNGWDNPEYGFPYLAVFDLSTGAFAGGLYSYVVTDGSSVAIDQATDTIYTTQNYPTSPAASCDPGNTSSFGPTTDTTYGFHRVTNGSYVATETLVQILWPHGPIRGLLILPAPHVTHAAPWEPVHMLLNGINGHV